MAILGPAATMYTYQHTCTGPDQFKPDSTGHHSTILLSKNAIIIASYVPPPAIPPQYMVRMRTVCIAHATIRAYFLSNSFHSNDRKYT